MTDPRYAQQDAEHYEEIPPSQAPRLLPGNDDTSPLSPGGFVAGVSAFADGATSSHRSRGTQIFVKVVVVIMLVSVVLASVWQMR